MEYITFLSVLWFYLIPCLIILFLLIIFSVYKYFKWAITAESNTKNRIINIFYQLIILIIIISFFINNLYIFIFAILNFILLTAKFSIEIEKFKKED